jgi:hypothetical protein
MSYRFEDRFRAGRWTEELPETCRILYRSKFRKLVHLVAFITEKFVTMQHGHVKVKFATDVYNKNIKAYDTVHTHLVGTM